MDVQFENKQALVRLPWPPPPEKDALKELGARWDPEKKIWRVGISPSIVRWFLAHGVEVPEDIVGALEENLAASHAADVDMVLPVPEGLEYRPFQKAGVAWVLSHEGTLIGDDMGLGKTIQALGVVNADSSVNSVLVVCPLSVALNWKAEAEKWLMREARVGVASSKELPDTDVVIAHWGIISKHAEALRERNWDLVVLDEAHYAKNPKAGRTKALFGDRTKKIAPLVAGRRLALSGTPIPNRPIEIYPVLKWLAPQDFPSWMTFALRYCNGHNTAYGFDSTGASHLDELQERLRSSVMVRRLKKDVLTELPEKTRQVITISADTSELKKALAAEKAKKAETDKTLVEALAKVELAKAGSDEEYKEAVNALHNAQGVAFTEMSRIRHDTALAKVPQVLNHVKDVLADEGQKLILFAHHRDVIDLLRQGLETSSGEWLGVKTVSIMGGDSSEHRQDVVTNFQNDTNVRVFLGSIGAAREGITLTAADVAIFAEIDWVPGNLSQAEARLHRIGQRNAVTIQHVLLDQSLDATMIQTIISKQEVLDKALDGELGRISDQAVLPSSDGKDVATDLLGKGDQAATKSATREILAKRAEQMTTDDIETVHLALRELASMDPDRARGLNYQGFSRIDVAIGHNLAERGTLSSKQAALGAMLIAKYHRQISPEAAGMWRVLGERCVEAEKIAAVELPTTQQYAAKPKGYGLR